MNLKRFSLEPFSSSGLPPGLKITGSIGRQNNALAVRYELTGSLAEIIVPAKADAPGRKDKLWEETCFELFIGLPESKQYWEFNLSPSGHWNVYRFSSYREDMREEPACSSLSLSTESRPDALSLSLDFDLDIIIPADSELKAGVSAVVKLMDGRLTYWALVHPGDRPDFHSRRSFIVEL
ncbi:MAG: DOMON-like domain-containing protein [Nitrospirae bacterium]|nr:DOMON-like domain-containing protein [Nitrospirota bacterium]